MSTASTERPAAAAPLWARAVATLGGIGHLRPGPGTYASAATALLWWLLGTRLPAEWRVPAAIAWAAAATLIGIPAATRVARAAGARDPQFVVVDEMAGQMVALVAAPLGWKSVLAGFILFRCFDVVKPPPVRQLERLREGAGIVLDDVGAGVYALIVMRLLLRTGWIG
ncbi:MAG TPA: phosphatidylglycerophosphatase A [Terriglobales bacterium]|nr:phosphatidylglycerophosphatase A [Terriglobales bacterium]